MEHTAETPTESELRALREFAHECRHGMYCIGDAPIPSAEALRAIDKLAGRVHEPACSDCRRST